MRIGVYLQQPTGLPINVENLCNWCGIRLHPEDFGRNSERDYYLDKIHGSKKFFIEEYKFLYKGFSASGNAWWDMDGVPHIYFNQNLSENWKRFVIVHEIKHLLEAGKEDEGDGDDPRSKLFGIFPGTDSRDFYHPFPLELLVPAHRFIRFAQAFDPISLGKIFKVEPLHILFRIMQLIKKYAMLVVFYKNQPYIVIIKEKKYRAGFGGIFFKDNELDNLKQTIYSTGVVNDKTLRRKFLLDSLYRVFGRTKSVMATFIYGDLDNYTLHALIDFKRLLIKGSRKLNYFKFAKQCVVKRKKIGFRAWVKSFDEKGETLWASPVTFMFFPIKISREFTQGYYECAALLAVEDDSGKIYEMCRRGPLRFILPNIIEEYTLDELSWVKRTCKMLGLNDPLENKEIIIVRRPRK